MAKKREAQASLEPVAVNDDGAVVPVEEINVAAPDQLSPRGQLARDLFVAFVADNPRAYAPARLASECASYADAFFDVMKGRGWAS